MDSASERGISGALALWGPLIIIGFLVLVLNTDDAPEAPSRTEATASASSSAAAVAPAQALPAPPAAETAAPEEEAASPPADARAGQAPAAEPAESEAPVPVAAVEPAGQSAESGAPAAAPVLEEAVVAAAVPEVVTVSPERPVEMPSQEAPPEQVAAGAALAGDIDLDTVLEVARSVIGQQAAEAPLEIAGASGAPPAPATSEGATSSNPLPREVPPAPVPSAAASASAGASGPWSAPQVAHGAETPIWSTGTNPWAASPSSRDEAMWGEGEESPAGPAINPDWPPPPASATAPPHHPPATAILPGSGYWPRPPVLVPCAPPWYWCIALPTPFYPTAPPGTY